MGWVTLSSKKVKTKKEHQCIGCTHKYPAGTQMQKVVVVDGGDFQSNYWCVPCEEFLVDKWSEMDNELTGTCWDWPEYKEFRDNKLKELTR